MKITTETEWEVKRSENGNGVEIIRDGEPYGEAYYQDVIDDFDLPEAVADAASEVLDRDDSLSVQALEGVERWIGFSKNRSLKVYRSGWGWSAHLKRTELLNDVNYYGKGRTITDAIVAAVKDSEGK